MASAIFTRRTETVTRAPIFKRRSRIVAQVARSRSVPTSAIRRSARQVHIWLRDEGIELPVKSHNAEADGVVWRLPV